MAINPSLLIVPYRYKAAKLYSQLPESGDGDFTVTRSTTATRTNASGLLESVASGVPRLDYTGGGCPALLVEPAATNLLLRSEEFDNAAWSTINLTRVANAATAPNGTLTADSFSFDAVSGFHLVSQSTNYVSGTTYTQSYFFKENTLNKIQIYSAGNSFVGALKYANFDLSNGVLAASTFTNAGIINYGNGWYRCFVVEAATATNTGVFGISGIQTLTDGYRPTFTGDGTSTLFAWGAQLETGSVATSYIPTVAATQTRNADVISVSSVSGLIGQTQGTLYAEVDVQKLLGTTTRGILTISDASVANRVQLGFTGGAANTIRVIYQGNSTLNYNFAVSAIGVYKLAFAYSASSAAFYVNGSLVLSSGGNSFSAPVGNINLGSTFDSGNQLNDRIRAAAIYTSRLSNAELETLTTL